jgi:hypothetical protein
MQARLQAKEPFGSTLGQVAQSWPIKSAFAYRSCHPADGQSFRSVLLGKTVLRQLRCDLADAR